MSTRSRRISSAVAFVTIAGIVVAVALSPGVSPTLTSLPSPSPSPFLPGSGPTTTPAGPSVAPTVEAGSPTTAPVAAPPAGVVVQVSPLEDEGMIHLTQRICGTARTWVAQANANRVVPPEWIVPFSATLRIDCSLAPVAAPAVVVPPVQAPRQAVAPPAGPGLWVHPLPGTCRLPYGGGEYGAPRDGGRRLHMGIDLGAREGFGSGVPIHAVGGGVITSARYNGGAGNQVVESIGGGQVVIRYNHLSRFAVGNGAWVNPGQVIGFTGNTGHSFGAHLHLEILVNGSHVDPVPWLAGVGVWLGC